MSPRTLNEKLDRIKNKLGNKMKDFCSECTASVNHEPVIILGNQKSGTSAIAMILGVLTGKSVTNDLQKEIENLYYPQVLEGKMSFARFVSQYRKDFSRDIIKEPGLTLLYDQIRDFYGERARIVFVLRDPRDNIRSILNRLSIPGNLDWIPVEIWNDLHEAWQLNISTPWLKESQRMNYIGRLAVRWNYMAQTCMKNIDDVRLFRYEDFRMDKVGSMKGLATDLGLPLAREIESAVEVQYQPKGNAGVDWGQFFGERNLRLINRICGETMNFFGYDGADQYSGCDLRAMDWAGAFI